MARQRFASVWDALEDTAAEAANMRARSELMIAVRTKIESWKVSQAEAARRLGLTQPRLNDLLRGCIDKFSLDALINLARPAGLAVRLHIGEADVDLCMTRTPVRRMGGAQAIPIIPRRG